MRTLALRRGLVVTGCFSVLGVGLAVALLRWSTRPAEQFVQTTVTLTAISLVPPFISGAGAATVTALVGLHLVAAMVMIPSLARSLRDRTGLVRPVSAVQGISAPSTRAVVRRLRAKAPPNVEPLDRASPCVITPNTTMLPMNAKAAAITTIDEKGAISPSATTIPLAIARRAPTAAEACVP